MSRKIPRNLVGIPFLFRKLYALLTNLVYYLWGRINSEWKSGNIAGLVIESWRKYLQIEFRKRRVAESCDTERIVFIRYDARASHIEK